MPYPPAQSFSGDSGARDSSPQAKMFEFRRRSAGSQNKINRQTPVKETGKEDCQN